jgi:hypothetical protein
MVMAMHTTIDTWAMAISHLLIGPAAVAHFRWR